MRKICFVIAEHTVHAKVPRSIDVDTERTRANAVHHVEHFRHMSVQWRTE